MMSNDNIFRILAVVIFIIGASISGNFRRKADREGGKVSLAEEGLTITILLRLFGLTLWVSVFAWLLNPAWMNWSRINLPEWVRWLGIGLGVLANILAFWIFSHLALNVSPTVAAREKAQLVTSGPYRWVRHPLYIMGTIAYLGFALIAENWWIALLSILVFAVLAMRTSKEEVKLLEKFGDPYREYMENTGRYVPKLKL
jgi:protein-S-isoprenylcysteine O-methyltransferase Ste14